MRRAVRRWARRTVSRVTGRNGDPGGGGFPGGLAAGGEAAGEQGRFAQGCEKVVGEAGLAGGTRTGVQGDPPGGRMVGGQGSVRVHRIVARVDDHGDGRWHGGRHGGVVVRRGG